MIEKKYKRLKEKVITETLSNGLKVVMIPKKSYHKTFAVITTPFGALDQRFQINNDKPVDIPAGQLIFWNINYLKKKKVMRLHVLVNLELMLMPLQMLIKQAICFQQLKI